MSFLLGILQAFLNALVNIFWKKSVDAAPNMGKGLFTLYAKLVGLLFVLVFAAFGMIDFNIFLDFKSLGLVIIAISLWIFTAFIKQGILKYNKVSTLLPFDNLAPLFTIFLGYFLFKDASIYSFIISIITIILVILFSFDYKKIQLPKKVGLLLLQQFIFALATIFIAYVLKKYNSASVAAIDVFFSIIILLIFTIKISELKQFYKQSKDFYKFRFAASLFSRIAYMISLFLISDIGIVLSTLLSFLTLGITLFFGYFYLDDKPSKKDIILAVSVGILVGLGLYFK